MPAAASAGLPISWPEGADQCGWLSFPGTRRREIRYVSVEKADFGPGEPPREMEQVAAQLGGAVAPISAAVRPA